MDFEVIEEKESPVFLERDRNSEYGELYKNLEALTDGHMIRIPTTRHKASCIQSAIAQCSKTGALKGKYKTKFHKMSAALYVKKIKEDA